MKIKLIEEVVENYIIGTIQGAYKQKRYWMKKRFDETKAIVYSYSYRKEQHTYNKDYQYLYKKKKLISDDNFYFARELVKFIYRN